MKFNKTFGFFLFLLCLATIGIAGCTQNLVATVGPGELGQVGKRGPVKDKISISKHASVEFNEDEADKILKGATEVAQKEDGEGDVPCDITLARDPNEPVAEFKQGITPSFVDSNSTYRSVTNDNPSDVKVIAGTNWCGKFRPDVLGCTELSEGPIVVVSEFSENLREPDDEDQINAEDQIKAILWLHEFGHRQGLDHRNEFNAVMYEEIELDHTHLNVAECG